MSSAEQQEVYSPEVQNECEEGEKGRVYRRRVDNQAIGSIEGKWTQDQNIRYVLFMDFHSAIFASKERRKSTRIFKSLAAFLTTRTPRQCRSHFQKIMNKYKKLNKVKQYYQQLIGPVAYQTRYQTVAELLKDTVQREQGQKAFLQSSVQTEPMQVRLTDLGNLEILRLMNLLNQYYRNQIPVFMPAAKVEDSETKIIHYQGTREQLLRTQKQELKRDSQQLEK